MLNEELVQGQSSLVQVEEPYNSLHDCVGCYPEKLFESCREEKNLFLGFPNRCNTNRFVQLQNMARGLKFQI